MSNAPLDKLAIGYGLSFLDQIKYAIRSMSYGDLMTLARVIKASGSEDEHTFAQQLWDWANENENKEISSEEK